MKGLGNLIRGVLLPRLPRIGARPEGAVLFEDQLTGRPYARCSDGTLVALGGSSGGGGGTGDVVGPSASVAGELAVYDGTTGKLLKRATVTGLLKAAAGVVAAAVAGTDYYAPGSTDVAIADGGTGASTAAGGFDALAPTTTAEDLIVRRGGTNIRLAAPDSSERPSRVLGFSAGEIAWVLMPVIGVLGSGPQYSIDACAVGTVVGDIEVL